ncbi:3TM-type holin [Saccharicrinis aurantiacus]|uniref:3TM-type holin n=1 Tax=Saccharicrinis aurantiacus TaxID=1849719 RepID=UPI00094FEBCF|nr:3TM-type holin [Saccharicrinis aurantiacus]
MSKVVESIGTAVDKIGDAFDKNFTSKEEVLEKVNEAKKHLVEAQKSIILAEATGSKMQRNWRPFLMYLFGSIIAYKYTVASLLFHFFQIPEPILVPDFWETIRLAMGGYVIGRSGEKILPPVAEMVKKAVKSRKERREERRNERQN